MPDQTPIDPLTVMQSLIAAWNRGQADGATSRPAVDARATEERLARMEEKVIRLEAQVALLAAMQEARVPKRKKAKGD
ncbi:MAG: hypothetical protein ABW173_03300 [Sphingomonas sp.]